MMASPKLPLYFRYKALFGYRFPTSPPKPFAFESALLEALNDLHSSYNLSVVSLNNTITIAIIVDLEQVVKAC
jgi:hypothetical protein